MSTPLFCASLALLSSGAPRSSPVPLSYPGKFVSESKFRDNPAAFIPHIKSRNRAALDALITKPEVEQRLLQRLRKKASLYAINFTSDGEPLNDSATRKIDVDGVVELYEHYIIPLTKEVEARNTCYLSHRTARSPSPRKITG